MLAPLLVFSEVLGKREHLSGLNFDFEASSLWSSLQAKNIQQTAIIVAIASAKIEIATTSDETRKAALVRQVDDWTKTAAGHRSEPEAGGKGTRELSRAAGDMEQRRDRALRKRPYFETASAALQIGIVLCSIAVVTGTVIWVWIAGGLGILGLVMLSIGLFYPPCPAAPGCPALSNPAWMFSYQPFLYGD